MEETILFLKRSRAAEIEWIYIYFSLSHTQILKSLNNELDLFRKVTSRKSNFCHFKDYERKWKLLLRWDWL